MANRFVTLRYVACKPFHLSVVEEGLKPFPHQQSGNLRYNYKAYVVPKDFDLKEDAKVLTAMYLKGLASNADGSIRVAIIKEFKKQL